MIRPEDRLNTHEVTNQPDRPAARDPWAADPTLCGHVASQGGDAKHLARFGAALSDAWALGEDARRTPPELRLFDRHGRRLDEVRFHPAYHSLLELGLGEGYAAIPWSGASGGHTTHAAMVYLLSGVEPGVCCPMTMTYAGVPALAAAGFDDWAGKLATPAYDPAIAAPSTKRALTLGMAMTEKQGGSDVRANSTRAEPADDEWRLTGHKWFCSAPMSDGFLTLAQTEAGLSCFLVPRWCEDGSRNAIRLQRLKAKLGNTANASAEIEYHGARAHLVGEDGDGIRAIIRMVHHTRLDTAMAPAGLMRAALSEAAFWARGRSAFQKRLIDQPLMQTVLADLALDWEGATALGLRVARAFDEGDPLSRVGVALAKFLSNKRAPVVIAEAMEVLGGMGYVDDTPMPMLYREAPLNGIWEGSGNVICLDILRTLRRDDAARDALDAELKAAAGADRGFDAALAAFRDRWPKDPQEIEARLYCERLAALLTAAVLIRAAPGAVADGYVATRLGADRGLVAGAVSGLDHRAILDRIGD
ncbi:acyl-CoA dehydrogenase family protein [Palleronia abyssalis]|uniref:Acyl-CoA dehydrogenase AidB n=1 Tax=Palleronia abyssalis TaxID=1501240 RepID=A0A2R8BRZ0_9RHOB|nr:acyl-CoA dehydrogenase family protein [Palleronia abyssalis]SPJ22856.1 Putative acyl-CoA dehydrogenase AidB [Palleronia abyssalis]